MLRLSSFVSCLCLILLLRNRLLLSQEQSLSDRWRDPFSQRRLLGFGGAALLEEVAVEGVQVGEGAGFDDVGGSAFAGDDAAGVTVEMNADGDFADGVLATRDALD